MDRSTYGIVAGVFQPNWGTFNEASVKTPNILSLKMTNKRIPFNPYTWERIDSITTGYSCNSNVAAGVSSWYFRDAVRQGRAKQFSGLNTGPAVASLANNKAVTSNKLLAKVRDTQIDLGVALGEYRETSRFIAGAMTSVAKSYKSFRRGDLPSALRHLGVQGVSARKIADSASNAWLAYSYALRPLIKDVSDASKALEKRLLDSVTTIRVRANHTDSIYASWQEPISGNRTMTCGLHGSITSRGEIIFRIENPVLRTLDQCGLVNPLSVAWELVPFSFVVDWFVPIGKFITGIVPPQGVAFSGGWISQKAVGRSRYDNFEKSNVSCPTGAQSRTTTMEVLKYREVLSSIPRYHLVVPDLSLSKSQITSGLALLYQQSKRFAHLS